MGHRLPDRRRSADLPVRYLRRKPHRRSHRRRPGSGAVYGAAVPSRIIVAGDVVRVYQDNSVVAEEQLPSSWIIS